MGVAAFQIVLRAERITSMKSIKESIQSLNNIRFVGQDHLGFAYEYHDGKYLYEILLRGDDTDLEFDASVRFALCNPDGIEQVFLVFIKWALISWHPSIYLFTSVLKQKVFYEKNEVHLFLENAHSEIQAMRDFWQQSFGTKRGAVRVEDVFEGLNANE